MSSAEELPQKPLNELPSTSGVCTVHHCMVQPRSTTQVKLKALLAALPMPHWGFELVTNCDAREVDEHYCHLINAFL